MVWQLYRAKQFNQFKRYINHDLKILVIKQLHHQLAEQRSELFPNNDSHITASTLFWTQYPSRILQAAIAWEVVAPNWLETSGNKRHSQHLFFIERDKLATFVEPIEPMQSDENPN